MRGVLISGVVEYTNDGFGTEKSVLLIEVSSIPGCAYIEGFHCIYMHVYIFVKVMTHVCMY